MNSVSPRQHEERAPSSGKGTAVKPLREMTTEELSAVLETLDTERPRDTALRLALYLELRRAAAEEWVFESGGDDLPER